MQVWRLSARRRKPRQEQSLDAAECVFAHAIKGIELEDIETRLTELERGGKKET
jgi:hypothetical protein